MRWFENLSIRKKLVYGFSISIILVVFLSIYSIRQLSNINEDYKNTINAANINVEVITDVSNSFMRIRLESRNMIINIHDLDSVKKSSDTINTLYKDINSKMNDYIAKINDTKTATLENITAQDVTGLSDALSKIVTALLNIENYAKANQTEEAVQLLQSLTPTAEAISTVLDDAYEQSLSASDKMVEKNSNGSNTAIIIMSVLSIIVEVLVIVICLIVSGVIASSLRKLREDAKMAAEGHLNVNLATNRRDEIGQLSNDFASVLDTFRLFSSEIKNMYANIDGKGDVEARIDESKFENDYKTLAQEINKTFDNIITDILVVVKAMDSYANGDFSVECKRFVGKKAMMHETLDTLRNNLSSVYNEINIVAASAGEGKLVARIESKKFSGDWRKLVDALNALLESVLSPVSETIEVLDKMSEGNLQVVISGDYTGEFGRMKDSINSTIGMINNYINEITNILSDMAKEDLTSEITNEYYGDFAPIKESLNLILKTFNNVLSEINLSAEQVSSGARQISESSMTLAQGASEQANSVDQLTVTLESINVQTSQNAQKAEDANKLATSAKENADLGNEEMNRMLDAMREISDSSQNISKIIKVIEEIALQTNLLALNAAVEAAHAGKHGKGFTVVADQVRNLAGRSAEAAKQTTALIEGTVEKVSHGMKIADDTAAMLEKIVGQISDISELVGGVATASNLQAEAISQVNMGIGQISQVTQINSATSQEEAASSQQLSSQAEVFKNMVSRFKLKSKSKSGSISKQTKLHDYDSPKRSETVSTVSVKPTVSEYQQPKKPTVSVKAAAAKPEFVKASKPEITQTVKPAVVKPVTAKPAAVKAVAAKPATAKPSVPVQRSGAVDANKLVEKKVQAVSTFNSDYDNKDFGKY